MIEVLVAILIVSLGVLALAGLLGVSSRLGKTSEFRATAALLAADITDRMRANRKGADDGDYALANTALADSTTAKVVCALATACTGEEIAAIDLAEWQALLYNALPQGTGYIAADATSTNVADVWVVWRDPDALNDGSKADNTIIASGLQNRCPPGFGTDEKPSCMYFRVGL